MDRIAGTDFIQKWSILSDELHRASADWTGTLAARVTNELDPMFLKGDEWTGDAPFSPFSDTFAPGPSTFVGAEQWAKRTLFKTEQWAAPNASGVVRAFISDNQTGWTEPPKLALDVAIVGGNPRVVAMRRPCPRCKTTTINKHGKHCEYVSYSEKACMDGLLFSGGLTFDRGEPMGSRKVADPGHRWAAMMER